MTVNKASPRSGASPIKEKAKAGEARAVGEIVYSPLYWINRERPTVFAVARAIVEGHGANPDSTVMFEGPAPVWTDHVREAKAALRRTAIMLRANGFTDAAAFLDKETGGSEVEVARALNAPLHTRRANEPSPKTKKTTRGT